MKMKSGGTGNLSASRFFKIIFYFAFFLLLLPASVFIFKKPYHNWDMLAYMALVVKMDNPNINAIHSITYTAAKENIPEQDYKLLTSGENQYRKRMAESPADFYSQLPYYVVKPMYTWFVYISYKAGLTLPAATVLPSVLAYLLLGLILFHWLQKYLGLVLSFVACLLIMYSNFVLSTSRISSPDSLSAFFLFAAFYFIIERSSTFMIVLLFLLSLFARVDNIIASVLIVSFLTFSNKWTKKISFGQYAFIMLLFTAAYFVITNMARSYGWGASYYSSFLHTPNGTFNFQEGFSLKTYVALMYSMAITAVVSSHFTIFALISLLVVAGSWSGKFSELSFNQLMVMLLMGIILIRFLLFPDLSDRFYTGFYLTIIILFIRQYVKMIPVAQPGFAK